MKVLRSLYLIINYKTFIVTILAIASTWLCGYYHVKAEFPLTVIGIAIVFPVVFSIDSAYKRREKALAMLGDFKAHLLAIYYASRDWLEPANKDYELKMKAQLLDIYNSLRAFFTADSKQVYQAEKVIFDKISNLSLLLKEFRDLGLQSGEMSRVSQYISKLAVSIENLKVILHYRTPITLRAYSKVFIYSFPILYGPYFGYIAEQYSPGLEYMMPVMFSFILVSLDNIQGHLENPFDQIGEDDIKFDVEEFEEMIS
ncbi:hypothetical protein C900_03317 [Fulvivirga imtechensis AK7]|uniref:Uncharacterized protein n=1 Tax=Fulvivirga imtechensis AK7 TaxID=1237149 RepID=L8JUB5_9BACT|nr:bestrophin family ion channel [Fulvivirga imtechensis]ELR70882.1 hypothetical protein C900_03317 [Fulvivirga imtechensis AK7]